MTEKQRSATQVRAQVLQGLRVMGSPPEERFDRIVRLAGRLLGTPVAMVNLIGADQMWTKAAEGIGTGASELEHSICRHAVEQESALEVHDLAADPRFATNPVVTDDPHLRFYAGQPLHADGVVVGTLCVLGPQPRSLSSLERELLAELASWAESELGNLTLNRLVADLAERERRLAAVLAAVPEGVLLVDRAGRARTANLAAVEAFGELPADGAPLADLFPGAPPDRPPFAQRRSGDPALPLTPTAITARAADGSTFPVEVTVSTLPGAAAGSGDAAAAMLVLVRDLRHLVRGEIEVRRQRRLVELVLASTGEGVVGADRDGVIVLANAAARRMLGRRESDLVGHRLHEVAHHSHDDGTPYPADECPVERARRDGVPLATSPATYWRRDGSQVPVEVSVAPMVVGEEVYGSVTTFRDVSDREQVEELKRQFTAVVSHELRTPLTSVKGSLGLLRAGVMGPLTDEQQRLLAMADDNADRLRLLVDDLLDLERLDAGRMPMRPERIDLADVARHAAESLDGAARAAGLELTVAAEPVEVLGDPHRLGQVAANLLSNAIKFSPPGRPVRVLAGQAGGQAYLAVSDRGRGIPADQLEAVFERFRQVSPEDSRKQSGTGLGLSIVRGIVERSGGRVEVDSELGFGTTFTVRLPLAPSPALPAEPPPSPQGDPA